MSNIKVTQEQVDGFIKTTEVMTIGERKRREEIKELIRK